MATEVLRAICTAAYWTANQTAMEALYGANNYYTSLDAFNVGEARYLDTLSEIAVAEVYHDITVNYVDFRTGWTTDSDCRIVIRCPTISGEYDPNYYHAGVAGNGVKLNTDGGSYSIIACPNMTIAGLEISQTSAIYPFLGGTSAGETMRSYDLIVHDFHCYTILNELAENCVFYDGTYSTVGLYYIQKGVLKNCSAYADGAGGYSGQVIFRDAECYGCVIYNTTTGGYGNFLACTGDYNASNDTSAPGSNSIDSISNPFVDAANGDLSIASSSVLKDAGPATPYTAYDITGTARPQATYSDIGAYEYTSGSSQLPINLSAAIANSSSTTAIDQQIIRNLSASLHNQSSTTSISYALATIISLIASINNQSATTDIGQNISRSLFTNIANASEISDINKAIVRDLASAITNQSDTSDISFAVSGLISLIAAITNQSATSDIDCATKRNVFAQISNQSATSDINFATLRNLAANISNISGTQDITIALDNLINLVCSIANQSSTSDIDKTVTRDLAASIINASTTSEITQNILRRLNADISNQSLTPDDVAAIFGGLIIAAADILGIEITQDLTDIRIN